MEEPSNDFTTALSLSDLASAFTNLNLRRLIITILYVNESEINDRKGIRDIITAVLKPFLALDKLNLVYFIHDEEYLAKDMNNKDSLGYVNCHIIRLCMDLGIVDRVKIYSGLESNPERKAELKSWFPFPHYMSKEWKFMEMHDERELRTS